MGLRSTRIIICAATEDPLGQWWLTKDEEAELARQNWQFEAPNPIEDL